MPVNSHLDIVLYTLRFFSPILPFLFKFLCCHSTLLNMGLSKANIALTSHTQWKSSPGNTPSFHLTLQVSFLCISNQPKKQRGRMLLTRTVIFYLLLTELRLILHLIALGSPHRLLLSRSKQLRMNFLPCLVRLLFTSFLLSVFTAALFKHENLLRSHNP